MKRCITKVSHKGLSNHTPNPKRIPNPKSHQAWVPQVSQKCSCDRSMTKAVPATSTSPCGSAIDQTDR